MTTELTPRQNDVLDFIRGVFEQDHTAPTVQEICQAFGFSSPNTVTGHLKALERKGRIRLRPGRARNIELIRGAGLPIIGHVAAGSPIAAIENVETVIHVPSVMFRHRPDYLLRVRGDSMIDKGIFDNDLIAIKKQSTAHPGEIVVARHDDEVTVKELQVDNGDVVLIPANADYEPIRIPAEQVIIEGIYVGLVRDAG